MQLIDVETAGHVWADRFEVLTNDMAARNEIVGRLARTLAIKLVSDVDRRLQNVPPQNWTSSDLLIRGRALINRPFSAASRQAAILCYEQALLQNPDSTHAMLGIALVLIANVADGWSHTRRPML